MLRLQASGRPSDYISDIKEFHWHSSQQPELPAVLHPSVNGRVGSLGVKQSQDHATSAFCASVIGSVKLITRIIGGAVTRLGAVTRPCSVRRLSPVTRSGARPRTRLPKDPRSGWWLGSLRRQSWHRSVKVSLTYREHS